MAFRRVNQPGELVRLDATGLTTKDLLENMLVTFRAGNRLMFLVPPGQSTATIQRIKMMLSRLRKRMENKGQPIRHFGVTSRSFPYTNSTGFRLEAIVLEEIRTERHEMTETFDRMIQDA